MAGCCLWVGCEVLADTVDWRVEVALGVGGYGVTVAHWFGVDFSRARLGHWVQVDSVALGVEHERVAGLVQVHLRRAGQDD